MSEQSRHNRAGRWLLGVSVRGVAFASTLCALALLMAPQSAHAWEFDSSESCAFEDQRNFDLLQSQLYFMLDRSGSMEQSGGERGKRYFCEADVYDTRWPFWSRDKTFECADCRSEQDCVNYLSGLRGWVLDEVDHFFSGYGSRSKWVSATEAIQATVDTLTYDDKEDIVQFGLGLFWNGRTNKVSPQEGAAGPIRTAIASEYPVGGTRMDYGLDEAIDVHLDDDQASSRPQATILITDGQPNYGSEQSTVDQACRHRNQVGPVHVVGFGDGTDESYNNLLAAAGGTGYCCTGGGDCNASSSNHVDPCGSNPLNSYGNLRSDWECHGADQVSNGTALQAVATKIANDLSCQIDASAFWEQRWSQPGYGCSSNDFSCLQFARDEDGFVQLSYQQDDSEGTGWRWLDPDQQETVVLNDQTCRDIEKPSTGNIVYLKRACMCEGQTSGANCSRSDTSTCECLDGNVSCSQSSATCVPKTDCENRDQTGLEMCSDGVGVCKVTTSETCTDTGAITCPATATAPPESPNETSCDNLDNDCDGQVDEDVYRSCDTGKMGRCAVGRQACNAGTFSSTCVQQKRPVPEICNGLDDDCDGVVDNIMASWDKNWNVSLDVRTKLACGQQNACICEDMSAIDSEYRGSIQDGSVDDEFDTMMQNTQTGCFCTE